MTDIAIRMAAKGGPEPIAGRVQEARVPHSAGNPRRCAGEERVQGRQGREAEDQDRRAGCWCRARTIPPAAPRKPAPSRTPLMRPRRCLRLISNAKLPAPRDTPVTGVTPDSFKSGKTLGRDTAAISPHLGWISDPAATAVVAFDPFFNEDCCPRGSRR